MRADEKIIEEREKRCGHKKNMIVKVRKMRKRSWDILLSQSLKSNKNNLIIKS